MKWSGLRRRAYFHVHIILVFYAEAFFYESRLKTKQAPKISFANQSFEPCRANLSGKSNAVITSLHALILAPVGSIGL